MITLSYANLTATTAAHSRVLVTFCVEFSPHCLALKDELAEAAAALRGADVLLALVDSKFEDEDRGQPIATLAWYEYGTSHPYNGGRLARNITEWVRTRLKDGAARDDRTGAKKDELRRLAASSAAPLEVISRPVPSQLGKLRSDMMKWYCVGGQHSEIPPCKVRQPHRSEAPPTRSALTVGELVAQTYTFMSKMRATPSAEVKKKLLLARQEEMKKLSPEERKKVRPQRAGTSRPRALLLSGPCLNRRLRWKLRRDTARCTRSTAKRCAQGSYCMEALVRRS